ncbi:MAG: acyl-CoA thioesterase [Gammaproteobacteria bacterium]
MEPILDELLDHLQLEQLERFLFRGESRDIGSPRVFGGQVLAQALGAALQTVKDRPVHSLHAYFLRAGDIKHPIVYEVDRARDGLSFSMRRVTAIQHGRQIFNLSASFHKEEPGLEHQFKMPAVEPPEALPDAAAMVVDLDAELTPSLRDFYLRERPFEFRFGPTNDPDNNQGMEHTTYIWFKTKGALADSVDLHRILLAYVSDFHLIRTATLPHDPRFGESQLQMASLDHAMWFHRDVRVDDWLLYTMDSPSSMGSRGFARGTIFNRAGELVASTAQEGLMRVLD